MSDGHVRVKALTGKEMVYYRDTTLEVFGLVSGSGSTLADCRQAMFESYRMAMKIQARYYGAMARAHVWKAWAESLNDDDLEEMEGKRREQMRVDERERDGIRKKAYEDDDGEVLWGEGRV